jgi:uncharacterized protein (UPF0248 family)
MEPVQDVLNRIRWDSEYAKSQFTIGYYDRIEDTIIHVPFKELYFDDSDHFDFQIVDENGVTHTIPLHRIREIYKNGDIIWRRSPKQNSMN